MASLMMYVLNDNNQLPMYCYADENYEETLMTNSHIQKNENLSDISSSELSSSHEDNRETESECITSNKLSSQHKVLSATALNICSSIDMNEQTNPFRKSQSINFNAPTEPMKQMHMKLWQENVQLLTTQNKFFSDLLKRPSITNKVFKNHLAFERHFNNLMKSFQEALVMEDDEFFASAFNTGLKTDTVNDIISSEISNSKDEIPIPKLPLSCMPFADQNITMLTNSFSHLFNTNEDNHGIYNTEFTTCNMTDSKTRSVQEVRPMHRVNDKRTGYSQHGNFNLYVRAVSKHTSLIRNNCEIYAGSSFSDSNRINGNMSLMGLTQNPNIFNIDHNSSNVFPSTGNKFNVFPQCNTENPFLHETNPFKIALNTGVQTSEIQSDDNCDAAIATRVQKQNSFMDIRDVYSTSTMDQYNSYENYVKNEMNNAAGPLGYECDINAINVQLSQVIRETDAIIHNNQQKRMALKQFDLSNLTQGSSYDIDRDIDEHAVNSSCISEQLKSNDKEISFFDLWEPFVIRTHIEHALKKPPNDYRNTVSDCSMPVKSSFLFQKICKYNTIILRQQLLIRLKPFGLMLYNMYVLLITFFFFGFFLAVVKGITFIFHMDNTGWILAHEFLAVFANLTLCPSLLIILESMTTGIKEIQRSDYPNHFLFFDKYV